VKLSAIVVICVSHALLTFAGIKPGVQKKKKKKKKKNSEKKKNFCARANFLRSKNKLCPKLCNFSKAASCPLQCFVLKFCYLCKQRNTKHTAITRPSA